jgi:hypothetical protein
MGMGCVQRAHAIATTRTLRPHTSVSLATQTSHKLPLAKDVLKGCMLHGAIMT